MMPVRKSRKVPRHGTRVLRDCYIAAISAALSVVVSLWASPPPILTCVDQTTTTLGGTDNVTFEQDGSALFRMYDPLPSSEVLEHRLKHKCYTYVPDSRTIYNRQSVLTNSTSWSAIRFVAYHNILLNLERRWVYVEEKESVQVFGSSPLLSSFDGILKVNTGSLRNAASGTFNAVVLDGVLENDPTPHITISESHRVLQDEGVIVLVASAFASYDSKDVLWRFTLDGLLALTTPFRNVLACGSWGNARVVEMLAHHGASSETEKLEFWSDAARFVRRNEPVNPVTVWVVAEK